MFVLVCTICTHVRLGIWETSLFVFVSIVVEGVYIGKTRHFGKNLFCNVFVVVEFMHKCNTGHIGNYYVCLYLCCLRGYVHMEDWIFCQQSFVLMFVSLYIVCKSIGLGVL